MPSSERPTRGRSPTPGRTLREMRLERAVRELRRSNEELEQFVSIVAHDLRSPLNSLTEVVQLLQERLADRPDAEMQELVNYTRESVAHMSRLINRLLDHSRVGRGSLTLGPCDPNAVLQSVINNLRVLLKETSACVTHDSLPVIIADQTLVTQLFQNLVENAIYYRSAAPPRVHVSARCDETETVFAIRDNGIGIAPEDFDRILTMFRRLPSINGRSHAGLGAGLATCKRIAELHGGRIWVESQPGNGANFLVAFPRQPHIAEPSSDPGDD